MGRDDVDEARYIEIARLRHNHRVCASKWRWLSDVKIRRGPQLIAFYNYTVAR
jgi:hypothetical protein